MKPTSRLLIRQSHDNICAIGLMLNTDIEEFILLETHEVSPGSSECEESAMV